MTQALTTTNGAAIAEQAAIAGDLAKLTPEQRMSYYGEVCRSLGLNPMTRPFEYLVLNDKLTLYARRDATDQLRKIHSVTISIVSRETVEGVYVVTARATTADGRSDESIGAVPLVKEDGDWATASSGKRYFKGNGQFKPLGPEDRANAIMKAESKAKRRVTLSIVGLGWTDESEVPSISGARVPNVNYETGEIEDCDGERTLLKQLRDDLKAIGGTPRPLTQKQVLAMSCDQIRKEIEATGDSLDAIRAQQAAEVPQRKDVVEDAALPSDLGKLYDEVDAAA